MREAAPTILFVQELGAGYGHLTNLLAVARHFPEARRVFVSPQPDLARPLIKAQLSCRTPCIEAPFLDGPRWNESHPEVTLAEVLDRLGFGDGEAMWKAVASWRALLDEQRPDLVVADYAPTLRIAAAGRVPQVVLSNGFSIPPDTAPLQPFQAAQPLTAAARAAEARILEAANRARQRLDFQPFPRFASLFGGDETFVTSFPEIDVFAERRSCPPIPPFNVAAVSVGPARSIRTGPHVFCYLDAGEPATNPVLTALNGIPRPSRVFVRNIDPHALAPHCAPQVQICTTLADLGALVPQARLIIHPGTQGTAGAALLAGTPQLTVPHSLDGILTAGRLCDVGVASSLRIGSRSDPAAIRTVIERMLDDSEVERRAHAVALQMQARPRHHSERPVLEACRRMLTARVS